VTPTNVVFDAKFSSDALDRLVKRLAAIVFILLAARCAEDRYRWNLANAWLNSRTPLPRRNFEEIVRPVSYASDEPIGAINVTREARRLQADVITGTTLSTHAFLVEKRGSG
jgi:hypothetical protein